METSNTAIAPAAKGHTHNHYHHNASSVESQVHDHAILSSHSIIIITVSVISPIVLVALFLMLRRLKSSKHCPGSSFKKNSSRFNAHTTINFTSNPNVKSGCLYVASNANYERDKGVVQIFTYKELEMATGEFSEGNVIENGGLGVVYKGVLRMGQWLQLRSCIEMESKWSMPSGCR